MTKGLRLAGAALAQVVAIAACSSSTTSTISGTRSAGASPIKGATKSSRTKSSVVSTAAGTGSTLQTLTVGGKSFRYVLHKPPGLGSAQVPLIVNLHGGQGTGESEEALTGMDALADQGTFIVAYPDEYTVKDVKALIKTLEASENVNPERVFITGISRGGVYSEWLGCKLAGEIAGIAAVAGPLPTALESRCKPAQPLPVLLISGTADPIVPYNGGEVSSTAAESEGIMLGNADLLSAEQTMAFWRREDGCTGATTEQPLTLTGPAGGTTTTVIDSAACQDGTRVTLYRVNGGGHTWPGGSSVEAAPAVAKIVGKTSTNFSASQVIWDFFASI